MGAVSSLIESELAGLRAALDEVRHARGGLLDE